MRVVVRVSAVVGIVVGLLGVVVPFVLGGLLQSWDGYGTVPIPGHHAVRLPAGEVDVSFRGISANGGGGGSVAVPSFSASVAKKGVADPTFHKVDGGAVGVNNTAHVPIWRLTVHRAGVYEVTTRGDDRGYVATYLDFGHLRHYGLWQVAAGALLVVSALVLLLARRPARGESFDAQ